MVFPNAPLIRTCDSVQRKWQVSLHRNTPAHSYTEAVQADTFESALGTLVLDSWRR